MKTPKIVSWPECQPELPGDGGGGDGVPTTLPIWQEPWTITHRNQISLMHTLPPTSTKSTKSIGLVRKLEFHTNNSTISPNHQYRTFCDGIFIDGSKPGGKPGRNFRPGLFFFFLHGSKPGRNFRPVRKSRLFTLLGAKVCCR